MKREIFFFQDQAMCDDNKRKGSVKGYILRFFYCSIKVKERKRIKNALKGN